MGNDTSRLDEENAPEVRRAFRNGKEGMPLEVLSRQGLKMQPNHAPPLIAAGKSIAQTA